jgi:beta,beta-carotene 9',10'-dioxygenase
MDGMVLTMILDTATDHTLGFATQDEETAFHSLPVEGELPAWLSGSLLRTGPAKFEVGEQSMRHWFDGLAMLHRYTFADGEVEYGSRFLRGRAFRAAEETGELRYPEFATDPCRSLFARVSSLFRAPQLSDNGAVNVSRIGDEFVALTETPLPVVFDPQTLESAGVAYEPPGLLTSAHPHNDPARREMVNFAAHLGPRSSYRFYAQRSRTEQRILAKTGVREPAYIHSFGMTDRYIVLAEGPFVVNPLDLALSGRPYIENFRWKPERGARFLVFERDGGRLRGEYRTDAFFTFHHVNTFERDGELVVDLCAFEDASIIDALYLDRMRAKETPPVSYLRRFRIDLDGGGVRDESLLDSDLELPRIDYRRRNGKPYRYVYGAAAHEGFLGRIVKGDVETGETVGWSEDGCWAGEPVFVPEPGRDEEDAGAVLSVVLDAERDESFLLVLDATTLEERARARVANRVPFSFHGQFFSA